MRVVLLLLLFLVIEKAEAQVHTDSNGNVGIGTTAPSEKLEVSGHIKTSGWIAAGGGGTSGYGILLPSTTNDYIRIFGEHNGLDGSNGVFLTGDNLDDGWIFRQSDCCGSGNLDYAKLARDQFFYIGGNVGIGTANPNHKFVVSNGLANFKSLTHGLPSLGSTGNGTSLFVSNNSDLYGLLGGVMGSGKGWLQVQRVDGNAQAYDLSLQPNGGNVGINTTDTKGYNLAVNGSAVFTKAVVKLYGNWPDYVFESTYKLPSLKEVEQYIKQHKHLPDVPSANEVKKEGLDLGHNQATLLKKIEELTLYAIDADKKLDEQQKRNKDLESRLRRLEEKLK